MSDLAGSNLTRGGDNGRCRGGDQVDGMAQRHGSCTLGSSPRRRQHAAIQGSSSMHLPRQSPLRIIFALVTTVVAVGCSGSGSGVTVEPIASTASSASSSVSEPSPLPSSSTSSSSLALSTATASPSGTDAAEAADRAAAEAQWIKSWDVYLEIARTPPEEREALAATVTVDPTKSRMLADAQEFDKQGLQTYGQLGHRISWPQPINGSDRAVIDDCQDASQSGSLGLPPATKSPSESPVTTIRAASCVAMMGFGASQRCST